MKFSLRHAIRWTVFISIITFVLAILFSVASNTLLNGLNWALGMLVVLVLVMIGIFFDIIGIATTAAEEKPFHAMASERVRGARHAIYLLRNADRVSNICNDVIGDISGIVSGTAVTFVVLELIADLGVNGTTASTIVNVVFAGLVSALTVGGKAFGKSFAINNSTNIVLFIGKFFYFMESRLHIRIFNGKKMKSRKRGKKHAARANQSS
jgi:CBS domain containing-hemolysin-like protein